MSTVVTSSPSHDTRPTLATVDAAAALRQIEQRVLWLSTAMIHHANRIRPNPTGLKVGGHQASCASMVSIMTSLWFEQLRTPGPGVRQAARLARAACHQLPPGRARRVVPDHAARVRWAAVLPEPVQRSGPGGLFDRVGGHRGHRTDLGRDRPALRRHPVRRSCRPHRGAPLGRQYSLVGDAELDEGAVWEAILDPSVAELGEIVWIVDLNRQSLDRVVPDHRRGPAGEHLRRGRMAGDHT